MASMDTLYIKLFAKFRHLKKRIHRFRHRSESKTTSSSSVLIPETASSMKPTTTETTETTQEHPVLHITKRMLEVACFDPHSALAADRNFADRIELCALRSAGGITPPLAWLEFAKHHIPTTPVYVMVRPRGGNFLYSDREFQFMKLIIGKYGLADGFVFGILDGEGKVDVERNTALVKLAAPRPCTFHRAFDETPDPLEALEDVAKCGFTTVLTSGGKMDAVRNLIVLQILVRKGRALGITVMPGGGIRSTHIENLVKTTWASWYHSSAILAGSVNLDPREISRLKDGLHAFDEYIDEDPRLAE